MLYVVNELFCNLKSISPNSAYKQCILILLPYVHTIVITKLLCDNFMNLVSYQMHIHVHRYVHMYKCIICVYLVYVFVYDW